MDRGAWWDIVHRVTKSWTWLRDFHSFSDIRFSFFCFYITWSSNKVLEPKAIYRFNAIPINLPMVFFTELEQIISQFVWKHKTTSNSQRNLEKEKWNWRNQPAWLRTILQSYSHQDSMVLAQRNIDQWNKIESLEVNPHTYTHLIFDKGGKNIQWRKDNLFNKWYWENWSTTCKRLKLQC